MMTAICGNVRETLGYGAALALQALQKKLPRPAQHAADFARCVARLGDAQDCLHVGELDILGASANVNQSNHPNILARLHRSFAGTKIVALASGAIK